MAGRAQLSYGNEDVCAFYVRKGKIFLHPRSADIEVLPSVEAAVDRMAVLLAHAILDHGDDIETDEVGTVQGLASQVVKLVDGRRS